jgi:hypothetical protein
VKRVEKFRKERTEAKRRKKREEKLKARLEASEDQEPEDLDEGGSPGEPEKYFSPETENTTAKTNITKPTE